MVHTTKTKKAKINALSRYFYGRNYRKLAPKQKRFVDSCKLRDYFPK